MFHPIIKRISAGVGAIALPVFLFSSQVPNALDDAEYGNMARNRYIGAKACKNCHKAKSKGAQYQKWESVEDGHAEAWKVLGTAAAKKLGAKVGVKDPQKDAKCLKCHVTAHGKKKREFKRGFKIELGVQCESCHGPGEKHAKVRFKEASSGKADPSLYVKIPDDEIIKRPTEKTCLECHNDKSPSFKPFCFKLRRATISHRDPRIKRTADEIKALECQCEKDKCACKKCECGGLEKKTNNEKGKDKESKK